MTPMLSFIITLLVVVLVLVIYRQLDRNNRSLDKVKRYSDKIKGELDAFVEGKTTNLKNLSIELDVHQKTAKEIVKRIASAEEGLGTRAQGLEKLSGRIGEYDKALEELAQMTRRVEENLKRLHQESEFVDAVGRRLRDAGSKMSAIEKSIPEITAEFAKQNEKDLKAVAAGVAKGTRDEVVVMQREVAAAEKSVKEFSTYLSTLESRRDAVEAQTIKNLEQVFQGFQRNAEATGEELRAQFETNLNLLLDKATDKGKGVTESIAELHSALKEQVASTDKLINEKLDAFQERVNGIEQTYQENIRDVAEKARNLEDDVFVQLKSHIESRAREVQKLLTSSFGETRSSAEESKKEIDQTLGEMRSQVTVWQTETRKMVADREIEFNERYASFADDFEAKLKAAENESRDRRDEQQRELDAFVDEMSSTLRDTETRLRDKTEELDSLVEEKERSFKAALEESEDRNNGLADSVIERFSEKLDSFDEKVNGHLNDVEAKVADYEADVAYRLNKIEEINIDIEEMDRNLRALMDKVKIKIESDFDEWSAKLGEKRVQERTRVEQELASIHGAVEELEKALNDLKAKAYENVSEKLQVFEDDFFADLTKRSEGLNEKIESWQVELKHTLDELADSHSRQRGEIEQEYNEELRLKLAEAQNRTLKQYESFQERVQSFEEGIRERVSLAEGDLHALDESLRLEVAQARESALSAVHEEFTAHAARVGEEATRYEREISAAFKELSDQLETNRRTLAESAEESRSEVAVWQEEVARTIQGARDEFEDALGALRLSSQREIEGVREEFQTEKEDVIASTQEERARLKEELQALSQEIDRLETEVKSRSEKAISAFRAEYDSFAADLQARTKQLQGEAEQKLKDFRASSQEAFDKMELAQKRLASKIEETYHTLSQNFAEVDKRQKDFVAQTKIFARADTLKASLMEDIEELKKQIDGMKGEAKDLREVEKNFLKVKKMGEEVSSKLSKFLAEKRRIEVMEGDFKKLIAISQSVDSKLDQVTSSHDAVQAVQARIRSLEELERDVLAKYERLEGKDQILETTTEGVDKNFQALETLERQLKGLEETVNAVPARLDEVSARIEALAKSKKDADVAVERLGSLGSMLSDIEGRTERMQQAREWLARTETRLEEISRQAEEQVKLLGSLLKEEGKQSKKEKGAPSLSTRDMVTRLAHQGWKVPQIAQATKLSRGEVELILELLPKSK